MGKSTINVVFSIAILTLPEGKMDQLNDAPASGCPTLLLPTETFRTPGEPGLEISERHIGGTRAPYPLVINGD